MLARMINFGQQALVLQGASTQQTGILNYPLGGSTEMTVPMQPIQPKEQSTRQMTVPVKPAIKPKDATPRQILPKENESLNTSTAGQSKQNFLKALPTSKSVTKPPTVTGRSDADNDDIVVVKRERHGATLPNTCEYCEHVYKDAASLYRHQLNTGHLGRHCRICEQGFDEGKLVQHMEEVHSSKFSQFCFVCGYGFKSKNNLREHRKVGLLCYLAFRCTQILYRVELLPSAFVCCHLSCFTPLLIYNSYNLWGLKKEKSSS